MIEAGLQHVFRVEDRIEQIQQVYDRYVAPWNYLGGRCAFVSRKVRDLGFGIEIGGKFRLDVPIHAEFKLEGHSWAFDAEGKIIDLTATQFNRGLNEQLPPRNFNC